MFIKKIRKVSTICSIPLTLLSAYGIYAACRSAMSAGHKNGNNTDSDKSFSAILFDEDSKEQTVEIKTLDNKQLEDIIKAIPAGVTVDNLEVGSPSGTTSTIVVTTTSATQNAQTSPSPSPTPTVTRTIQQPPQLTANTVKVTKRARTKAKPPSKGSSSPKNNKTSKFFGGSYKTYDELLALELKDPVPDTNNNQHYGSIPDEWSSHRAPTDLDSYADPTFMSAMGSNSIARWWGDKLILAPKGDWVWEIKAQKLTRALRTAELYGYGWDYLRKNEVITKDRVYEICQYALSWSPWGAALSHRKKAFWNLTWFTCARPGEKKPASWWYGGAEGVSST